MTPIPHRVRHLGVGFLVLTATFALSISAPIPTVPDARRAEVLAEVSARLPGWRISQLRGSWENAYSVVTSCSGRQIGFQFVPGHGLPADDAWLQPTDDYSRDRLRALSDHWRALVWYGDPALMNTLSCSDELAGNGRVSMDGRQHD